MQCARQSPGTIAASEHLSIEHCPPRPKKYQARANRLCHLRILEEVEEIRRTGLHLPAGLPISRPRSRPARTGSTPTVLANHLFSGGERSIALRAMRAEFRHTLVKLLAPFQFRRRGNVPLEQRNNLRSNGTPVFAGPLSQPAVKFVRHIFHIKGWHMVPLGKVYHDAMRRLHPLATIALAVTVVIAMARRDGFASAMEGIVNGLRGRGRAQGLKPLSIWIFYPALKRRSSTLRHAFSGVLRRLRYFTVTSVTRISGNCRFHCAEMPSKVSRKGLLCPGPSGETLKSSASG